MTLAIAGARSSGKTVYIGVMMAHLKRLLRPTLLMPLGNTKAQFAEMYDKPLFQEHNRPQATHAREAVHNNPLMWSGRTVDGTQFSLSVIDIAGEDCETGNISGPEFSYLGHADMALALMDPTRVQAMLAIMSGATTKGFQDDTDVMLNTLHAISTHRAPDSAGPTFGLVLTKFDQMQRLAEHDGEWGHIMARPGSYLRRDPMADEFVYDKHASQFLHSELLGVFERLQLDPVVTQADLVGLRTRLFATSALGFNPPPGGIDPKGICQFRVLDPIKLLFRQTGLISEKDAKA